MVFQSVDAPGTEWVAFEQDKPDGGFEAVIAPVRQSRPSKRSSGTSSRRRNNDSGSVATWMNQPINSDSSWAPLVPPPPKAANAPASEHPTANKRRPPRGRTTTSIEQSTLHRRTSGSSNPVSSDSDTSGDRRSVTSRGRSVERAVGSPPPLAAPSSKTKDSRRGRSRTRNSSDAVENSSLSQASLQTSTQTSTRGKSRGRSGSRTRTSVRERSASRTRASSVRERSASRTRTLGRERSASRTRTSGRGRSASISRTRSTVTNQSRSGSRPPTASSSNRDRSTSRTPVKRSRSMSRPRASRPPPSTTRTRMEMRSHTNSSNSVGAGAPRNAGTSNRSVVSEDGRLAQRKGDDNIGRDISFGETNSGRALTPVAGSGKPRFGFMERLFGDQVSVEAKKSYLPRAEPSPTASVSSLITFQPPEHIHPRIMLTATVYNNTATNLWIATINTNQKGVAKNPATASKYLKAFSFSSEKEARESAIANAPPKMLSFNEHPNCFICNGKFAMFRRAGHCRNCGVCVCNTCSTMWPSKMIPETYNLKKESQVKICKSCNHLSGAFKKALLGGEYEEAIAIYGSGNINLRTPFPQSSKKKEEIMYPIHCAVAGGNIDIVRWLMENHFCPIKVIRTGGSKKRGGSADVPILTSKNRSVLAIAMTGLHVDILRYLVADCGVSIYESKDLKGSLRALEAVLLALPGSAAERRDDLAVHRWDDRSFDGDSVASSLGADQTLGDEGTLGSKRRNVDSCIICYDNPIDCVMTPCGHQVMCLQCSKNLTSCPVCNTRGEFIKIFRP